MNTNRIGSAARQAAMIAMMLAAATSYAADGLPSTSSVWSNGPDVSNRSAVAAVGKTRAQVRSELDQANRSGEGAVGFTALSARELDPDRFVRSEPNLAHVDAGH